MLQARLFTAYDNLASETVSTLFSPDGKAVDSNRWRRDGAPEFQVIGDLGNIKEQIL